MFVQLGQQLFCSQSEAGTPAADLGSGGQLGRIASLPASLRTVISLKSRKQDLFTPKLARIEPLLAEKLEADDPITDVSPRRGRCS